MGYHKLGGCINPVWKPVANKWDCRGNKFRSKSTISITKQEYDKLQFFDHRKINNIQFSGLTYFIIVDNGAKQSLIGNTDWIVSKQHNNQVDVSGVIGNTVDVLHDVDVYTMLIDEASHGLAILWLN